MQQQHRKLTRAQNSVITELQVMNHDTAQSTHTSNEIDAANGDRKGAYEKRKTKTKTRKRKGEQRVSARTGQARIIRHNEMNAVVGAIKKRKTRVSKKKNISQSFYKLLVIRQ